MNTETLQPWQAAWRTLAAELPTRGLQALAEALRTDDPALVQGKTVLMKLTDGTLFFPCMVEPVRHEPCAGGCAAGYAIWKGGEVAPTVGEVYSEFASLTVRNDPAARSFVGWFDATPRPEMRTRLLPEVERVLAERSAA